MRTLLALLLSAFAVSALAAKPGTLIVLNESNTTASLFDLATKKVVATIPTGACPHEVAVSPDGKIALVSNAQSASVAVFDAATRREVRRISMPAKASESGAPVSILTVPARSQAFVAMPNLDEVAVLDLETWEIVDRLTTGREPDGLDYSPLTL